VNEAQAKYPNHITKNDTETPLVEWNPLIIVLSKNTAASYPWANERAHSLRYEAVLETVPNTNSIVSIS